MALLFISSIVPDDAKYHNEAFTRSGNNVLLGIAKGLNNQSVELLSLRPMPSFPAGKLWIPKGEEILDTGQKIIFLPTLNIKLVKNVFWNILCYLFVLKWAAKHKNEPRNILVYNTYLPSISTLYKAARKTKSKLFSILYDLGIPPKRLGLSRVTMWAYKVGEKNAKKYIPKLDGRIVINERIAKDYAPNNDFILIDGGINQQVIEHLFPLELSNDSRYTMVLAGMLWDQNGTKLVLDMMAEHPELPVDVVFAGKGIDVPLIEAAAKNDSRIIYKGMLNMSDLFKVYQSADILLNLRLEEETDYHFPSKLLEYLVTGKHVISTPIAHAERDYGQFLTILCEPTPEGLAKNLEEIMSKGKQYLHKKGISAQNFMLENRNWTFQTKRIEAYIHAHQ